MKVQGKIEKIYKGNGENYIENVKKCVKITNLYAALREKMELKGKGGLEGLSICTIYTPVSLL